MARINIEDSLFRDPRFSELMIKCGSRPLALGLLIDAWILAQHYWKTSSNGIPKGVWTDAGISNLLIECRLADDRGDFVYVRGSNENFDWLRKAASSGRAGGLARRGTGNHSEKSQATLSESKPLPLPLTLSLKKERKRESETGAIAPRPPQSKFHRLIEIWNERCGGLPKASAPNAYRNRFAKIRWGEIPEGTDPEKYFSQIVDRIASSPFCNGKNDRGWKATVDWLLKPDTHLRVNEGKYDKQASRVSSFLESWKE